MRTAILLVSGLLLAGCDREKSFDERFADTEKAIREKATDMDAELTEQERLASEAAPPSTAARAEQVPFP